MDVLWKFTAMAGLALSACPAVWAVQLSVADSFQAAAAAKEILAATGVQGGLIVHLGCGDDLLKAGLTAALRAGDAYVVHGLARNAAAAEEARRWVRSAGLEASVAVEVWNGRRLPYVDNLVNLLVADGLGDVSIDEVLRVLTPGGTACIHGRAAGASGASRGRRPSTTGPTRSTTPATMPFRTTPR